MAYELITFEFRSELHARWAIFFSDMGIPWTYEPAVFTAVGGMAFTPTFWLPGECFWFHVQEAGADEPIWWEEFAASAEGAGQPRPTDDHAWDGEVVLDEGWRGRAFLATGPIPEWICFSDDPTHGPWRNHETYGMATYDDGLYQWTLCPQCGLFGAEYCGYTDRLPCACPGRPESESGANARPLLQAYREARHEEVTARGDRVFFTALCPQPGAAEANRLCVRSCRSVGDQLREAGAGAYTEEHADTLCEACPGFVCSVCSQRPAASVGMPCWVCQPVPVLTQSRARRLLNDLAAEVGRKLKKPLRVIHPVINDAMGIRFRDQVTLELLIRGLAHTEDWLSDPSSFPVPLSQSRLSAEEIDEADMTGLKREIASRVGPLARAVGESIIDVQIRINHTMGVRSRSEADEEQLRAGLRQVIAWQSNPEEFKRQRV
ncbi:hypothetical protein ACE1OC_42935 (plasmid) [Streptomyces sp. DSM 116496]|uniref:hypothetical protein n=1 Tax=Streptomyces stoeckheimensis TaxID=3344656 RepID=UPI0038B255B9